MTESRKEKFYTLDGLRGVAALLVFLFHLTPVWPYVPFPGSAYLAVDFFFMLSGFVIGHAYHDRLAGGLGFWRFLELRVMRLYPLHVLACLLGLATPVAIALLTDQRWIARPAVTALPWAMVMLPGPGHDPISCFVLNPPAWSLSYEIAICIAYAALFPWLTKRALIGIVSASAILLMTNAVHTGSVNLGQAGWWGLMNLSRPTFSSAMGMLLYRLFREGSLPAPTVRAEAAIILFLCLTLAPASGAISGAMSASAVIFGFPVVMILAIANQPAAPAMNAMSVAGDLSYPLYALHWPIIMAVAAIGRALGVDSIATHLAAVPLAIAAAWIAARHFDDPVRNWAAQRLHLSTARRGRKAQASDRLPVFPGDPAAPGSYCAAQDVLKRDAPRAAIVTISDDLAASHR